jgi:hypothetical protein
LFSLLPSSLVNNASEDLSQSAGEVACDSAAIPMFGPRLSDGPASSILTSNGFLLTFYMSSEVEKSASLCVAVAFAFMITFGLSLLSTECLQRLKLGGSPRRNKGCDQSSCRYSSNNHNRRLHIKDPDAKKHARNEVIQHNRNA